VTFTRRHIFQADICRYAYRWPSATKFGSQRPQIFETGALTVWENGLFGHFRLFRFRPKMNSHFPFIFRFRCKNVTCVGPKMLCSQLNRNKFCDIGTGDFRFRLSAENRISFLSAFSFTAKNVKCIFGRPLYSISNCFRLHPNSNHGLISYRFWDRRRFQLKIAKFPTPLYFAPLGIGYRRWGQKWKKHTRTFSAGNVSIQTNYITWIIGFKGEQSLQRK